MFCAIRNDRHGSLRPQDPWHTVDLNSTTPIRALFKGAIRDGRKSIDDGDVPELSLLCDEGQLTSTDAMIVFILLYDPGKREVR